MSKAIKSGLLAGLLLASTLFVTAPAQAETITICHTWVIPGYGAWEICHEVEV